MHKTLPLLISLFASAEAVAGTVVEDLFSMSLDELMLIEVTGSRIKREGAEGALPLTVITARDIAKQGIQTIDQLMHRINIAGNALDNLASGEGILGNVQSPASGQSRANLRGQGAESTLVLLNGRRVATNGRTGSAVDINSIPMEAIDRVEVLRDGASAVYGTDAIGGVINFITRNDYRGAQFTGTTDVTEAGGGNIYRGTVLVGGGDLEQDGWTVFASLSAKSEEILFGRDRDFTNTFQPERGLAPDTSGTSIATIVPFTGGLVPNPPGTANDGLRDPLTGGRAEHINPLRLPGGAGCDSLALHGDYDIRLWNEPRRQYGCAYDYPRAQTVQQPNDSYNFISRASLALSDEQTVYLEAVGSKNESYKSYEPYQVFGTSSTRAYPLNPTTQATYDRIYNQLLNYFGPTATSGLGAYGTRIGYRWRCDACGNREFTTETESARLLLGFEGAIGNWDYDVGLAQAYSQTESLLQNGFYFVDGTNNPATDFFGLIGSGLLNPWLLPGESQSEAAISTLMGTSAAGTTILDGKSESTQIDIAFSGSLGFGFGTGDLQLATGLDLRKESLSPGQTSERAPIFLEPTFAGLLEAERDISAVYAELFVPLLDNLEFTVAGRYDDYSDFGETTNPKVSFKYSPLDSLSFRGAYNTGFRVPSFFQQYSDTIEVPTPQGTFYTNPATCDLPNPSATPGCEAIDEALIVAGGRTDLQPETATQQSFGFIWEPRAMFKVSIDWWQIKKEDSVIAPDIPTMYTYYEEFADNFLVETNPVTGNTQITIDRRFDNAGGSITSGYETNATLKIDTGRGQLRISLNGSYIQEARAKPIESLPYSDSLVGDYLRGTQGALWLRWKHSLTFDYSQGDWNYNLSQIYRNGYDDELPRSMQLPETDSAYYVPSQWNGKVDSYSIWNFSLGYSGFEHLMLRFGIKNLLDKDPPFTAHQNDFSVGAAWEPRVADPRGRAYTLYAEYKF